MDPRGRPGEPACGGDRPDQRAGGRDVYPGANFVFQASSMIPGQQILPIDLRFKKDTLELRYGDVVERHLVNGDIVLLNRQPTLHKQSMMGHIIKVINNPNLNTFRLSVNVCKPYNADVCKPYKFCNSTLATTDCLISC